MSDTKILNFPHCGCLSSIKFEDLILASKIQDAVDTPNEALCQSEHFPKLQLHSLGITYDKDTEKVRE